MSDADAAAAAAAEGSPLLVLPWNDDTREALADAWKVALMDSDGVPTRELAATWPEPVAPGVMPIARLLVMAWALGNDVAHGRMEGAGRADG